MNTSPTVAVAILNYNSLNYLQSFLPKLVEYTPNATIYCFDNDSKDESKQFVTKNFPEVKWVQFIQNYGFAGGYNKAMQQLTEDVVVLLNSDVEVTQNWLPPLINSLNDENIAACQPKILDYNRQNQFEYAGAAGGFIDFLGYPFCRGRIFDTLEEDNGQYDNSISVFWASGACLAIKRELFLKAGGFDERFFAHQEEIDLCWRLQQLGYKIKVEPISTVYHVGGGALAYTSPRKTYLNFRNNAIMCFKNWQPNERIAKMILRTSLDKFAALREILKGNFSQAFAIYKAILHFYLGIFTWRKQFTLSTNATIKTIYPKSIVVAYFFKKIKTYSKL